MAKEDDKIELEGVVDVTYPGGKFLVKLTTEGFEDHPVRARLSGKMRMHYIRIVQGDRVKLQVSPYNLDEGLITYRQR
ncbi:translation initiation factor IF-1 [bacterium]|nr:translation initiation factor IF-1 [bacterium]MBT6831996.1 translation initiation factor IF-1 [bacterium]MBT6996796.1 translation initiation factor IF-1 [bacterium]MBT7772079.1 translation initiation factor IF-1 [bacterium]